MSDRGIYGTPRVGAAACGGRGAAAGTWIVGGALVVGAVLWARHQSIQIESLYASAGLPYQSFVAGLRERTRELSHGITRRLSTTKGT